MELKFLIILTVMFYMDLVTAQQFDLPPKCKIDNSTCELATLVSIATQVIPVGAEQFEIPKLDPIHFINKKVTLLCGMLEITLHDLDAAGLSDCRFSRFETDVNCFQKYAEVTCKQYVITGTYTLKTNPKYVPFIGNVTGNGKLKIVADDWYFNFITSIQFVKKSDGHIYVVPNFDIGTKLSKVLKKLTVSFDKILLNGQNITKKIVSFLNQNWKLVLDTIGQPFHDEAMDYYTEIYTKLYNGIPADALYIDDLIPYLSTTDAKCNVS